MFAVYFGISNQPDTLPADKPLHSKCQLPLTPITLLLPPHLSLNRGTKIIFDRETFAVRPRN